MKLKFLHEETKYEDIWELAKKKSFSVHDLAQRFQIPDIDVAQFIANKLKIRIPGWDDKKLVKIVDKRLRNFHRKRELLSKLLPAIKPTIESELGKFEEVDSLKGWGYKILLGSPVKMIKDEYDGEIKPVNYRHSTSGTCLRLKFNKIYDLMVEADDLNDQLHHKQEARKQHINPNKDDYEFWALANPFLGSVWGMMSGIIVKNTIYATLGFLSGLSLGAINGAALLMKYKKTLRNFLSNIEVTAIPVKKGTLEALK